MPQQEELGNVSIFKDWSHLQKFMPSISEYNAATCRKIECLSLFGQYAVTKTGRH